MIDLPLNDGNCSTCIKIMALTTIPLSITNYILPRQYHLFGIFNNFQVSLHTLKFDGKETLNNACPHTIAIK